MDSLVDRNPYQAEEDVTSGFRTKNGDICFTIVPYMETFSFDETPVFRRQLTDYSLVYTSIDVMMCVKYLEEDKNILGTTLNLAYPYPWYFKGEKMEGQANRFFIGDLQPESYQLEISQGVCSSISESSEFVIAFAKLINSIRVYCNLVTLNITFISQLNRILKGLIKLFSLNGQELPIKRYQAYEILKLKILNESSDLIMLEYGT